MTKIYQDDSITPCSPCLCPSCGGCLNIKATIIDCQVCRKVWGRVNEVWIEDSKENG